MRFNTGLTYRCVFAGGCTSERSAPLLPRRTLFPLHLSSIKILCVPEKHECGMKVRPRIGGKGGKRRSRWRYGRKYEEYRMRQGCV